ncbi:MAG: glycosyltransferase family 10 [Paracoccaceae bacterium]
MFTDTDPLHFLKQFPGRSPELDGVSFTFGLSVPPDGIDVLIVYNRASYTLRTPLPRARTAFVAAEPDVIHPYKTRYLNQYGIVVSVGDASLDTEKWQTATCWYWFAGINFEKPIEDMRGYDFFAPLKPGEKQDKISVVTSSKVFTPYHRKRVEFLNTLKELIPEHLEIFGRGYRSVADKADALLPYRYHLAIENGAGPDTWTEKLADSYLCWAIPFYAGCTNLGRYFPPDSAVVVDLDAPEAEARRMVEMMQNRLWQARLNALTEARRVILEQQNIARLFVRLAHTLAKSQDEPKARHTLWSERSFRPEPGTRGSYGEFLLRNLALTVAPNIELRSHNLRKRIEAQRAARRLARLDKSGNAP